MIRLTERVEEVCNLVAKGLSDKEIATALDISVATVKLHIWGARKAFGVNNRTKLALLYLKDRGLVTYISDDIPQDI